VTESWRELKKGNQRLRKIESERGRQGESERERRSAPVVPSKYCPPESSRIMSFVPTSLQVSGTALRSGTERGRGGGEEEEGGRGGGGERGRERRGEGKCEEEKG
jgi:hypothetical protein